MYFNHSYANPWASFSSFMGGFSVAQGASWGNFGGGFGRPGGFDGWMAGSMLGHSLGGLGASWNHLGFGGQHGNPRAGHWDSEKGGYVVGANGRLNVTIKEAEPGYRNQIQYCTGNGDWKNVGYDEQTGKTQAIRARPGSTVQFRIDNGHGGVYHAGTTANAGGMDHGKVTKTATGTQIGFEDLPGDTKGDFNDAVIEINDGKRRRW